MQFGERLHPSSESSSVCSPHASHVPRIIICERNCKLHCTANTRLSSCSSSSSPLLLLWSLICYGVVSVSSHSVRTCGSSVCNWPRDPSAGWLAARDDVSVLGALCPLTGILYASSSSAACALPRKTCPQDMETVVSAYTNCNIIRRPPALVRAAWPGGRSKLMVGVLGWCSPPSVLARRCGTQFSFLSQVNCSPGGWRREEESFSHSGCSQPVIWKRHSEDAGWDEMGWDRVQKMMSLLLLAKTY